MPTTVQPDEKAFQQHVTELAQIHRWSCYHTFDSRHSAAGFPDLILISAAGATADPWRDRRLLAVELKAERGKVTDEQRRWLDLFGHAATPEAMVWRPSDWADIETILRQPARSR